MTCVLRRHIRTALWTGVLVLGACEQPGAPEGREAPLAVRVELSEQPIATITLEVTGAGIPAPLVFNLQIANGVASGTINVPVGPARTFTGRAFDATGLETYTGQVTIDVRPGMNPNLPLTLLPRAGGVPVTVTIGSVTVAITPATASVEEGQTVQLAAAVTDGSGNPVGLTVTWATSNAAVATVDQTGLVTGVLAGQVEIVAIAEGAAASVPVTVTAAAASLTQWSSVTGGGAHTCALTKAGVAYCWGSNEFGQLGDGTTTDRRTPTPVSTTVTFLQLVAGTDHTCGIATAGSAGGVYCWGANSAGQLGDFTTTDRLAPVLLVGTDGGPWTTVASGAAHGCASVVGTTTATFCWGDDTFGQLGDGPVNSSGSMALVSGGFSALTAGRGHTCGATPGGDIYCWGRNDYGQVGDGTTTDQSSPTFIAYASGMTINAISAGDYHTCIAGVSGGTRVTGCWGRNDAGQLGDGTTTSGLVSVLGGNYFTTVTAGAMHTCALAMNVAFCWGANASGQLGDGTSTGRLVPTQVVGGILFASVDAGATHTCGVTTEAAIYCWGSNAFGQLGDGGTSSRSSPARVSEP